jgi:hypothetical protein
MLSRIAALGVLRVLCGIVSAAMLLHVSITFFGRAPIQLGIAFAAFFIFAAAATHAVSRVLLRVQNVCELRPPEEDVLTETAKPRPPEPVQREDAIPERPPRCGKSRLTGASVGDREERSARSSGCGFPLWPVWQ